MFGWFKPKPAPAPAVVVSLADLRVKAAWGLTTPEWLALTDPQRRELRNNITHALRKAS